MDTTTGKAKPFGKKFSTQTATTPRIPQLPSHQTTPDIMQTIDIPPKTAAQRDRSVGPIVGASSARNVT